MKVRLAVTSLVGTLLVSRSSASSSSSTPIVVASPTPDSVSRNYVALVHNFWIQEQAADVASNGSNLAAEVCLGTDQPGAPTKLQLIDPPMCRERAVALLAVHEKFLSDLATTPPAAKSPPMIRPFGLNCPRRSPTLRP